MKLNRSIFGRTSEGQEVELFTLESETGFRAEFISYGARLRSFRVPAKEGPGDELCLGLDSLEEYEKDENSLGACLGRFSGKIAGGRFAVDGVAHQLVCNQGKDHLDGGKTGFQRRVWKAESFLRPEMATVLFFLNSPEGEEGYPGDLRISLAYTLSDQGDLSMVYEAEADESSPINPTNRIFWNLGGVGSGSIEDQELRLFCPFYLPEDGEEIPTGEVLSVRGTALDFTQGKRIGQDILQAGAAGYNHSFALQGAVEEPAPAALLRDPRSGRTMEVLTTLPGLRFNSGDSLKDIRIAPGETVAPRGALGLETGHFSNSVNLPHLPSAFVQPGETYRSMTMYRFRQG